MRARYLVPAAVLLVFAGIGGCGLIAGINELEEVACVKGCPDTAVSGDTMSESDTSSPDAPDTSIPADVDDVGEIDGSVDGDSASDVSEVGDGPDADSTDADDDGVAPDADTGDGADSCLAPDASCPGTGGPTMVRVGCYCVDSTEVTNEDYGKFVLAKGLDVTGQPGYCSFNTTWTPAGYWPYGFGEEKNPVVGVNWCQAFGFCKWAGKRLCGRIGGGTLPFTDYASASQSQWYNACSKGGTQFYPYGSAYVKTKCNGIDFWAADAGGVDAESLAKSVPVSSMAGCVGGTPGLYDMSGNILEWEDSCTSATGGSDECHIRGGSYIDIQNDLQCANFKDPFPATRNSLYKNVGFRCCSDP